MNEQQHMPLTAFRMPPDQREQLRKLAESRRTTTSELLRHLVYRELDRARRLEQHPRAAELARA